MTRPVVAAAVLALLALGCAVPTGDTLDTARKRGKLIAGVKENTPPFGFHQPGSPATIVGYDVDMVKAVGKELGLKVELKAVTSANRIPFLERGEVDLVAATMTRTEDRAREIDFSLTYFVTGQKFLARKGTVTRLEDLEGKKIGTVKGSTSEENVRKALPSAAIVTFSDYPQAFLALQEGLLAAVTTDETILASLLAQSPRRGEFEIPALQISTEPYAMGVRKGDAEFLKMVDEALLELERSGEARRIFDQWFGPGKEVPLARAFTIGE